MRFDVITIARKRRYGALRFGLLLLCTLYHPLLQAEKGPRWYSQQQVIDGEKIYQQHCANCHGKQAQSTPDWKKPGADGFYPPPPLNGNGHAWHHDLPLLQRTIREGGQKLGGKMPPFDQILDARQIDSVIAYFQSLWPAETYRKWAGRFQPQQKSTLPSLDDLKNAMRNKPNLEYLKKQLGLDKLGPATPSTIDKLYRLHINGKNLYLSQDGRYAIIGDMIDLKTGKNLSKSSD